MSELINKQSALDLVRDKFLEILDRCDKHYDVDVEDYVYDDKTICDNILTCNKEIYNALSEMSTIYDAVPVIRCRDCKHSMAYYHGEHSNLGTITYCCKRLLCDVKADDYCSMADRR